MIGHFDKGERDLWLPFPLRRSLDGDLNMRRLTGKEDRRTDVKKWARRRRRRRVLHRVVPQSTTRK